MGEGGVGGIGAASGLASEKEKLRKMNNRTVGLPRACTQPTGIGLLYPGSDPVSHNTFIASQTMSLSASSLRSDYRSLDQSVLPRPHTSSYALPFMVPSNPTSCFALLTLTSSIK